METEIVQPCCMNTSGGYEVSQAEVLSREEHRHSCDFGNGIGEAVAHVQTGGVAAFAEVEKGSVES